MTDDASGALAIVGGKLTTYRRMAQDVVDRVTDRPCRTHRLPLVGAAAPAALRSVAAPERLVRRYGTEAPAVAALADGRPELLEPLGAGVPACGGGAAVGDRATSSRSRSTTSSTAAPGPGSCRSGGRPRSRPPSVSWASANFWLGRAAGFGAVRSDCPSSGRRPTDRTLSAETPRTHSLNAEVRPQRTLAGWRTASCSAQRRCTSRASGSATRRAAAAHRSGCCRTRASTSCGTAAGSSSPGPATGPVLARVPAGAAAIGVRFRVGAAGAALGLPAAELLDATVPLEDVWGRDGDRIAERVAAAPTAAAQLADARAGCRRAAGAASRTPLVRAAATGVRRTALGIGDRQLRRRFAAAVGYGPKTLQRILRFQRFLALAAHEAAPDLAWLALEAGYADQAHLTRECTRLAGLPPAALLAAGAGPAGEQVRFLQDSTRVTSPRWRHDRRSERRHRLRLLAPPGCSTATASPSCSTAAIAEPVLRRCAPTATPTAASATRSSPTCARR